MSDRAEGELRSQLISSESQSRRSVESECQTCLVKRKRGYRCFKATVCRTSVDDHRLVPLVCHLDGRSPLESGHGGSERDAARVIGIGVIAAELLRSDGVADQGCLLIITDVPVQTLGG